MINVLILIFLLFVKDGTQCMESTREFLNSEVNLVKNGKIDIF